MCRRGGQCQGDGATERRRTGANKRPGDSAHSVGQRWFREKRRRTASRREGSSWPCWALGEGGEAGRVVSCRRSLSWVTEVTPARRQQSS